MLVGVHQYMTVDISRRGTGLDAAEHGSKAGQKSLAPFVCPGHL